MSTELNDLPQSINWNNKEYIRRIMTYGDFVVIEYSKKPVMLRHGMKPGSMSKEHVEENLLVESKKPTIEEAVKELKKKIKKYL